MLSPSNSRSEIRKFVLQNLEHVERYAKPNPPVLIEFDLNESPDTIRTQATIDGMKTTYDIKITEPDTFACFKTALTIGTFRTVAKVVVIPLNDMQEPIAQGKAFNIGCVTSTVSVYSKGGQGAMEWIRKDACKRIAQRQIQKEGYIAT